MGSTEGKQTVNREELMAVIFALGIPTSLTVDSGTWPELVHSDPLTDAVAQIRSLDTSYADQRTRRENEAKELQRICHQHQVDRPQLNDEQAKIDKLFRHMRSLSLEDLSDLYDDNVLHDFNEKK